MLDKSFNWNFVPHDRIKAGEGAYHIYCIYRGMLFSANDSALYLFKDGSLKLKHDGNAYFVVAIDNSFSIGKPVNLKIIEIEVVHG